MGTGVIIFLEPQPIATIVTVGMLSATPVHLHTTTRVQSAQTQ